MLLDAYARRHEGQKIYLRQASAQRWIEWRDHVLQGGRPNSKNRAQLQACDFQLQTVRLWKLPSLEGLLGKLMLNQELATITDDMVYTELLNSDMLLGRWTAEDPSMRATLRWLRARR